MVADAAQRWGAMVRKAVILTAGLSTRTYPLTVRKPKPFEVGERP